VIFSISPSSNSYSWRDAAVSFSKFSSLFTPPSIRITYLTRAHFIQKWTGIFSPCLYAFSTFLCAFSQTSSSKVPSSVNQGLYLQITFKQSFNCCLVTQVSPCNKKWCMSERKGWTLHWFCPILSHFQNYPSGPVRAPAVVIYKLDLGDCNQKRLGDYQLVLNSHFIKDHFCFLWAAFLQRAFGQKKHAKYYMSRLH
jgi:hypothetical protein